MNSVFLVVRVQRQCAGSATTPVEYMNLARVSLDILSKRLISQEIAARAMFYSFSFRQDA